MFEAMALVHSRVRRVIFGVPNKGMGGLGGVAASEKGSSVGIHSLPGTNHHYRAFRFDINSLDSDDQGDGMMQQTNRRLVEELRNHRD